MIKLLTSLILIILIAGCSKNSDIKIITSSALFLDIPIVLTESTTTENNNVIKKTVVDRIAKNSAFNICNKSIISSEVCVKVTPILLFPYGIKSINVEYIKKDSDFAILADFPTSFRPSVDGRFLNVHMHKTKQSSQKMTLIDLKDPKIIKKINFINIYKDFKINDTSIFQKSMFSNKEMINIQKDIHSLHDRFVTYRDIRIHDGLK